VKILQNYKNTCDLSIIEGSDVNAEMRQTYLIFPLDKVEVEIELERGAELQSH
jgi:hypothetical protein